MVKQLLRATGLYVVLKYFRKKYFPSKAQREEKKQLEKRITFYSQFIGLKDVCFDVGANIGNRTEIFLKLGARVIAIEPQPECAQMLKLRFKNKISLINKAIGAKESSAEMYISDTSEISSLSKEWIDAVSKSRFRNSQWNDKIIVKITTLDNLIKVHGRPKFCKIDVEGYEEEVLKGLSIPIKYISFEYTIPERLDSLSVCFALLLKIGHFDCNYTIGEKMQLESEEWLSPKQLIIALKKYRDQPLFGDVYIHFK